MVNVINSKIISARKKHYCDLCGEIIEIGEEYDYSTCEDGYIYNCHCHLKCTELAEKLGMYDEAGESGVNINFFQDTIDDYILEKYGKSLGSYKGLSYKEKVSKLLDEINNNKTIIL